MKTLITMMILAQGCALLKDDIERDEVSIERKDPAGFIGWERIKEAIANCKPNDGLSGIWESPRSDYRCGNGARFSLKDKKEKKSRSKK